MLRRTLKSIRSACNFWIAEQTPVHLAALRLEELKRATSMMPAKGKLLEIGAGSGWQAEALSQDGYMVSAIDLSTSSYKDQRIYQIQEYDGKRIPYDNNSFDIVFSSNVLEHIPHLVAFQSEILRVLKPDGCAVHVLPSSSWRLWSNITGLVKFWRGVDVHGEYASNALTEIYYFSGTWWKHLFQQTGWTIIKQSSNKLFYTGYSIMDSRISIKNRQGLSKVLGSSCNIFLLKKQP